MSSRFLLIPIKDDNQAGRPKPHEGRTWIIVMDNLGIPILRNVDVDADEDVDGDGGGDIYVNVDAAVDVDLALDVDVNVKDVDSMKDKWRNTW